MNSKQILRRREILEKRILVCEEKIKMLKGICRHELDVTYKYRANTGNWSRSDDNYWMEWHCKVCDKQWETDQGIAFRVAYPNAREIK